MPWRRILGVLALHASLTTIASAQLSVVGVRDLAFGNVVRGIPASVAPSDPVRSGRWDVTATLGARVQVRFTLPNRLNGPAGATMPISFANNDAIAIGNSPLSNPVTFNPKATMNFQLVTSNRFFVMLGGTVSPTATQTAGPYTNTVVMTVTVF